VFGAVIATPIITQPQNAILWMGRIAKMPVVREDQIVIRSMMYLCVSYDHRAIDGSIAAQFLQHIRRQLEDPRPLLNG
jgi:pyruvate/2-oxoglutarate dehydrogenase complex dihydrolipoamide acyltransferase (E2) component